MGLCYIASVTWPVIDPINGIVLLFRTRYAEFYLRPCGPLFRAFGE